MIDSLKRENEMLKENLQSLENLKLARNDAYAEIEVQVEERVEQWKVGAPSGTLLLYEY